ncbi:MAG: hypothetical protein J4G12_08315 [Gemmatimonadetes bacterium]|nr:hypothetical protein [Gemmatimonadota bacterium]
MRSRVTLVNGNRYEVEIDGGRAAVNGESVASHLEKVADSGVDSLLADGRSHRVVRAHENDGIEIDGIRFRVRTLSAVRERLSARVGGDVARRGPEPVRAPMPGMVVAVRVASGDLVEAGQGVAVVEAMKMENELVSHLAGTVRSVKVGRGDRVSKGEVIVEFEADR